MRGRNGINRSHWNVATRLVALDWMQNSADQNSYRVYLQFSASREDSEC